MHATSATFFSLPDDRVVACRRQSRDVERMAHLIAIALDSAPPVHFPCISVHRCNADERTAPAPIQTTEFRQHRNQGSPVVEPMPETERSNDSAAAWCSRHVDRFPRSSTGCTARSEPLLHFSTLPCRSHGNTQA